MNILWLAHRDPINPKAGGAEEIIKEVGLRLVRRGYDVTLLTGGWEGAKKEEICCGIRIKRVGYRAAPHFALPVELLKHDYDLVICDLGHAVPWVSPLFFRKKHIVHFVHLHARSLPGQVNVVLAKLLTAIEKMYFLIYRKSEFITISETSKNDLLSLGIKEKKITIINPGVNRDIFKPSNKSINPSLIYFGGLRPYKRPEEALYLLNEVKKHFENITLYIVGEGPSKPALQKLASDLDLKGNVIFTGRLEKEKLARILSEAWLNIHSSITEGWGISIIEASSAGTPTVAYDVPGVSNSVENGRNGLKVKDGNREALINAALSILYNHEKWSSSALKVSEKYSWDKAAEMWEDEILKVTGVK